MTPEPDLCVIGAGAAGLSVAAGAAQLGADTVLVERARMGGDCLYTGCVPSKSLLAAAKAVRRLRQAARLGIVVEAWRVDAPAVRRHVRDVIAAIEPHDSQARFEGLGVRVIRAEARFVSERELEAGEHRVRPRRFVVATGSRPAAPPIPGLERVPYLTNESVFDLDAMPERLLVIGGGPIGVELAQAHALLGSRVTVLEAERLLAKDDPEMVELIRQALRADGVTLREGARIAAVEPAGNGVVVVLADGERLAGDRLLVATGRKPTLDGLQLERAGIETTPQGIKVDARLRSVSNRRVYAVGDVAGGPQFTHLAGFQAGIVIRNVLFRLPARADRATLPWVTYTEPELANVGLTEQQARAQGHDVRVLRRSYADLDRARADGDTDGLLKAVVTRRGRILGCAIVGAQAGELLQPWVLAMSAGLSVGKLATMIAPYPTLGEISKRAAGSFYEPSLFSERTRSLVRLLRRLG